MKERQRGMAPTPAQLEREAAAQRGEPDVTESEGRSYRHVELRNPAPPELIQLKGELHGIHWKHHKTLLDLLEVVIENDRQFQIARRVALDAMNAQWGDIKECLTRNLVLRPLEEKKDEGQAAKVPAGSGARG